MRIPGSPLGFHRRSAILTGVFLLLWLGAWLVVWIQRVDGGASWLERPGAGGVAPVGWMRFAVYPLGVWLIADLWLIRRAPPEFRKAQWASTAIMLLLLLLVASALEPLAAAFQHADAAP